MMNILPETKTISQLLFSRCQFSIPRFQREYSWEKRNYKEFLEDIIDGLKVDNTGITDTAYFLGTMLFIGSLNSPGATLDVVDGQQRLTVITVLFSAISDHFRDLGQEKLSESMFKYIMTEDDNGEKVRILKSATHYPFFSYFIQDRLKKHVQDPGSEEEQCIKDSFDFLYQKTSEENLRKALYKNYGKQYVNAIAYADILKALRDQVLKSKVVVITTNEKNDATRIFGILNAKGKHLASVDLIKNQIFSVAKTVEPADFATVTWNEIRDKLYKGNENIGMATYFRHYWISKYTASSENKLYDKFVKNIKPADESRYREFLIDMNKNADFYMTIVNPSREDFGKRKEYFGIVQSLDYLSNTFNIVQVRVALMAMLEAKERNVVSYKVFKKFVNYIEGFHFVYNTILSRRANVLDSPYATFARDLRKCQNTVEAHARIEKLITKLDTLYPSFVDFQAAFVDLRYSKQDLPDNLKVKYIINKMACFESSSLDEVFYDDGSIEHIYPEGLDEEQARNIGNLILLEVSLNESAGQGNYSEKKAIYSKSKYTWVQKFVDEHSDWTLSDIETRAYWMAKTYYYEVLGR